MALVNQQMVMNVGTATERAKWERELRDYISKDFFMQQFLLQPLPLTATEVKYKERRLKPLYGGNPLKDMSFVDIETRLLHDFKVTTYADFAYILEGACPVCAGSGLKDQEECWHCNGNGTDPNPD